MEFNLNEFRVIIAGSRSYTDYERLKQYCDYFLSSKLQDPNCTLIIVSGHASGADKLGEQYAKERGLKCEIYPADWKTHGKKAGFLRNSQMANIGNALIAFKSSYGTNVGTNMMINLAKERGLNVRVVEDEED